VRAPKTPFFLHRVLIAGRGHRCTEWASANEKENAIMGFRASFVWEEGGRREGQGKKLERSWV
jgi:hypothetical protein